ICFFTSRRRHTRSKRDWSSDVCSSDLKYEVDYCLKKDCSMEPPRYYVFFGAKDEASMTAAFKEYTGWQLKKSKKISVRKKLSLEIGRASCRERVCIVWMGVFL